ncbi:MAG: CPBP family intramembrane metalloprotease [Oscillospiraceae bacterium]|jgi:membrane protease YdiL (CAAX protease family)|nr:CPBP family intramembrane metalloprotease [Oscillospiraceae bacterium]
MDEFMQSQDPFGRERAPRPARSAVIGAAAYIVMLVCVSVTAYCAETAFGMYGTLITQAVILAFALLTALSLRKPFREIFPFKKPERRLLSATLMLYIGVYALVVISSSVLAVLFPEMTELGEALSDFFFSIPALAAFAIVAVTPAVCEEALFRGALTSAFGGIRRDWLRALIVGAMFGVFHMHPLRAVPTGILGAGLCYLVIKTKNMIYPMLVHFAHNFISLGMVYLLLGIEKLGGSLESGAAESAASLAGNLSGIAILRTVCQVIMCGGVALLCLFAAWRRLNDIELTDAFRARRRRVNIAGTVMVCAGIASLIVLFIAALAGERAAALRTARSDVMAALSQGRFAV